MKISSSSISSIIGVTWLTSVWSCSGALHDPHFPDGNGSAGVSTGGIGGGGTGAGGRPGGSAGTTSGGSAGTTSGGSAGTTSGGSGGRGPVCEVAAPIDPVSVIISKPCVGPLKRCDPPTNDPCTRFLACASGLCQTTLNANAQCRTNQVEPCVADGSPGVMICSTDAPPHANACKWQGLCQACGKKNQPCCTGAVHCSEADTACQARPGTPFAATGVCTRP
jgi:hypothetical protein